MVISLPMEVKKKKKIYTIHGNRGIVATYEAFAQIGLRGPLRLLNENYQYSRYLLSDRR
jgi:hypothetical protein